MFNNIIDQYADIERCVLFGKIKILRELIPATKELMRINKIVHNKIGGGEVKIHGSNGIIKIIDADNEEGEASRERSADHKEGEGSRERSADYEEGKALTIHVKQEDIVQTISSELTAYINKYHGKEMSEKLIKRLTNSLTYIEELILKVKAMTVDKHGNKDDDFVKCYEGAKDVMKLKYDYDLFQKHLSKMLDTTEYRFVNELDKSGIAKTVGVMQKDVKSDISDVLYGMWSSLKSSDISQSNVSDDKEVLALNTIADQANDNVRIIDDFEILINIILEKAGHIKKIINGHEYIAKPRADDKIVYAIGENNDANKESYIKLTKGDIYDFMSNVSFEKQDNVLELIQTKKLLLIERYVSDVNNKYNNNYIHAYFSDSSNINNTITKYNDLMKQSGGVKPIPYKSEALTNNLLSQAERIQKINKSLQKFKSIAKDIEEHQIMFKNYMSYMTIIATNNNKKLRRYKYITRGIMGFYKSILNDINTRIQRTPRPKDAMYFHLLHGVVIKKISKLSSFIIDILEIKDVVAIDECTGPICRDFALFNHFKDILDSYRETFQNNICIYARINDYGTSLTNMQKMIVKKTGTLDTILVNPALCTNIKYGTGKEPESFKFNMVFDSDDFKDNADIAMYMTISANISKKKSVALITYGYSGTGKTYTLFGKAPDPKTNTQAISGILQSAIQRIATKEEIYIRIYELYGLGVKYEYYWCGSVTEDCYLYKINQSGTNEINMEKINKETILKGVKYQTIKQTNVSDFFKNFSTYVDKIDEIRRENKRIIETPNNLASSRSIIIYDMMIRVKDNPDDEDNQSDLIRLAVIDLPGREEIVQTYADNYIEKKKKDGKNEFDTDYHRAILSSMSIDPMYLGILCPDMIANAFNSLTRYNREYIINYKITEKNTNDCLKDKNKRIHKQNNGKSTSNADANDGYNDDFDEGDNNEVEVAKVPTKANDGKNSSDNSRTGTPFGNEVIAQFPRSGAPGAQGAKGAQGAQGDQGDKGAPGAKGAKGAPGDKGDKGDKSAPGDQGAKGAPGDQGAKGAPGDQGASVQKNTIKRTVDDCITLTIEYKIELENDKIKMKKLWGNPKYKYIDQYRAMVAVQILYRILFIPSNAKKKYSRFDVLNDIYSYIGIKYGYAKIVNSKGTDIVDGNIIDGNIVDKKSNKIEGSKIQSEFGSFMAPFEGIYINENILGLIKTMSISENLLNKGDKYTEQLTPLQDDKDSKNFKMLKLKIRKQNAELYEDPGGKKKEKKEEKKKAKIPNDYRSDILKYIYEQNKTSYLSSNIFLYKDPLMGKILEYYTKENQKKPKGINGEDIEGKVIRVNDIKMFYLFSNTDQQLKCEHQYKLLDNTRNLIQMVDNTKK